MRVLRWFLLILYVALIVGLGILETFFSGGGVSVPIVSIVTIIALAVFILGAGSKDLWRPIRRPRLVLPVAVAAFMVSVLIGGMTIALSELFRTENSFDPAWALFWGFLVLNWVFWGVLLFAYTRKLGRFRAISRLAEIVFAGSLAELLAAVPSHIFVMRRGGCFVGIFTGIGIVAGVCVMIWSFGPGIFLLFLQQADRAKARQKTPDEEPSRSRWQFQLRTMLLVAVALNVVFSLLKTSWGHWLSAALTATLVMLLLTLLFLRSRVARIVAALGVVLGLVWVFWTEEPSIGPLAFFAAILLILLVRAFSPQEK